MQASNRVIINTGVQYLRTILSVAITLYTSRIVLDNLGVDDFGIYSLIGGIVAMLAFIQSSLSKTTQRYLAFYYGEGNKDKVIDVFNNSVITLSVITIFLCIALILLTGFVFNHMVIIDASRIQSAKVVYYAMVATLFFNLISTPYLAALIARENIVYSSIVQIIDSILKLPIAISLIYISNSKLEVYSFLSFLLIALNFVLYFVYCKIKYDECRHFSIKSFKLSLFKEMFSFTGWNVYATMCIVGRGQGVAILLNNFFGTAINAAYGIGNQVASQIAFLSNSLTTAINPQIMKAEGSGNRRKMIRLSEISCKYSFILMSIVSVPLILYMPTVLSIWLKEVPDYAVMFCQMIVLANQIDLITMNLSSTNQAVGNIRNYTICIQTIKILTLPAVWISLKNGADPMGVMIVYVVIELVCALLRIVFLKIDIGLPVRQYLKNVLIPIIPIVGINTIICYYLSKSLTGWLFLVTGVISIIITISLTYLVGLKEDERNIFEQFINKLIRKK